MGKPWIDDRGIGQGFLWSDIQLYDEEIDDNMEEEETVKMNFVTKEFESCIIKIWN